MKLEDIDKKIDVFIAEYFYDTEGEIRLALRDFAREIIKECKNEL